MGQIIYNSTSTQKELNEITNETLKNNIERLFSYDDLENILLSMDGLTSAEVVVKNLVVRNEYETGGIWELNKAIALTPDQV